MADLESPRIAFARPRLARVLAALSFAAAVLPLAAYGALWLAGGELLRAVRGSLESGVFLAIPLGLGAFLAARPLAGLRGALRCEGDELVVERRLGTQRIPRSAVKAGIIVPSIHGVSVELDLAGGRRLTARVGSVAEAEALLAALRVDVANQRCRVQLADPTASLVIALGVPVGVAYYLSPFFGAILMDVPASLVLVLAAGLYAASAAILRAIIALPDITIGTDGLSFRQGFREIFVPFAELADVRMAGLGVNLIYRDGRKRLLRSAAGLSPARYEALMLRIRAALGARAQTPATAIEQLDRAGRSVPEWRAALSALARRGVDYRAAGLSADDLEALLASPDATAERRLGAAVALSASKHPAAPERIRIAAAQCASERLRVALEKLSDGEEDDAALAEALGEEEAERA
jgi:hypothetical protein